jgi:hypothetical protein
VSDRLSSPAPHRSALLEERTRALAGVLARAEGPAELLLAAIGVIERAPEQLAEPPRVSRTARGAFRAIASAASKATPSSRSRGTTAFTSPTSAARAAENARAVSRRSVAWTHGICRGSRTVAFPVGYRPARHLLERQRRLGNRVPQVGGERHVEAGARAACPFNRAHEGLRRSKSISTAVATARSPFELLGIDALTAGEALCGGYGGGEVHAGAEDAIAGAGEDRTADVRIGGDALPGRGQRAQRRRVESICALRPIDRDQRDVRMMLRELEPDQP